MTYDPTDIPRGLIRTVSDADQHSQIARLTRRLDEVMDAVQEGGLPAEALANLRGEGRGLAFALSICTCYSLDEIREQVMLRWQDRQEEETDEPPTRPAAAATGRRKRKRA